ncbi:Uncharacterised protein [Actinomyces bovis]|uniref:Amidohydrolase-related domain-containing protein n=1 Tax=Actinomyces bovis TaxID=1658 RepID=A0ABY1VKN8_9ACTO|nr:amidohydrolase family protein [Actinomyces bovis]SPT52668.1 Uncharacterised protein [Actinomyces bovis]VEG54580.1 Uncharacterised protein [Actinomyces israelii]
MRGTESPVGAGTKPVPVLTAEAGAGLDGFRLPGGLVDVHCHLGLGAEGAVDRTRTLAQARAARSAGVLLVRDCGAPTDTHWLTDDAAQAERVAAGAAPGELLPGVLRAGRHLARPRRYLRGFAEELENPSLLPEAVARQARAGDGWVKLVGDWIDRSAGADADIVPLWPAEVLRDAVAAAHENGARVTVHTFAHATLAPLLEAGVDCLEHATGAGPEEIAQIAAQGVAVTPTLLQVDHFPGFAAQAGARYPRYAATVTALHAGHEVQVAAMHEAGVRLLPGSDAGGSLPHDTLPRELLAWRRVGLADAEILRLATTSAREFLGVPLGEGEPMVLYDADPATDLAQLLQPRAIVSAA